MLMKAVINRKSNLCPFKNDKVEININPGECVWLRGVSGVGKSTIARQIVGLGNIPGAEVDIQWSADVAPEERVGMLFQQGVLVDSLNVEENIALGFKAAGKHFDKEMIRDLLRNVGLKDTDMRKMAGELSGGMLRRVALAQILAQGKKLIILDEPFVGLDDVTIQGIVAEFKKVLQKGISLLLISHQEEYVSRIANMDNLLELYPCDAIEEKERSSRMPHWRFMIRTLLRIWDYLGISLPLIFCAFLAAGFAISMLFAELLNEVDVNYLIGQVSHEWSSLVRWFIGHKIDDLVANYLPVVKQKVYAAGLAKAFVVELGPLLTALLLAGRIGGSYAGEVGMMQATNQNSLLKTLGLNPRRWTLTPSVIAAFIAAPILTAIGTVLGLIAGGLVAMRDYYHLFKDTKDYWVMIKNTVFDYSGLWSYPPFVNVYRSLVFMFVILFVAEVCSRYNKSLQPRDVPKVITWAVVLAGLFIIIADWGLSQLLFKVN